MKIHIEIALQRILTRDEIATLEKEARKQNRTLDELAAEILHQYAKQLEPTPAGTQ